MSSARKAFIILTPAFSVRPEDKWLPFQGGFIRTLNSLYPGLHVVVMAFHFPVMPQRRTDWHGNEILTFSGDMKGKLHSLLLWTRVWRELDRIRRSYDITGILSMFCSESAFIGHYYAAAHGLKHKIWLLGQDARKDNAQVGRIRPHADELIAISDFLIREFRQHHGIRPAHLIPIGIVPEDFPEKGGGRHIDLIGAGTLSRIKRYDMFIDIVAEIRRAIPEVQAVICGDGSEQASLQQLITEKGLDRNISLATGKSRHEVLALMQQSKILLHPSEYEGFGMVCTEALYAGAQVISFIRPMDAPIPRWHIVLDQAEMTIAALDLLQQETADDAPLLPFAMTGTVREMMRLYSVAEA